jgi:hypothetical protein
MSTERGLPGADGATLVGLGRTPPTAGKVAPAMLTVEREDGGAAPALYRLEGGRYVVGRHEGCDVRIVDRDLSRQHAALERDGEGRWWVVDLGGASGTFVNGRRLEGGRRRRLGPSDVVHAGAWRLRVSAGEVIAGPALLLPPDGERSRPDPARIRIYDGSFADRELRLDRGEVVIGAGEGVTVPLEPGRYAGIRVVIRPRKDGGFDVRDESEAPSLSVNGRQLTEYTLGGGDVVLRIGPMEVQRRNAHDAFTVRYMPGRRRPGQETPSVDEGGPGGAPPASAETNGGRRATMPMRTLAAGEEAPAPAPWAHDTAPLHGSIGHDTAPFPAMPAPAWLGDGDTLPGAPPSEEAAERAPKAAAPDELDAVDVAVERESAPTVSVPSASAAHDTQRIVTLPFSLPTGDTPPAAEPHASEPDGGQGVRAEAVSTGVERAEPLDPPTVRRAPARDDGRRHATSDEPGPRVEATAPRGRPSLAVMVALAAALIGVLGALFAWWQSGRTTPPVASSSVAAIGPSAPASPSSAPGARSPRPAVTPPAAPSAQPPSQPTAPSAAPRAPTPSRPPQRPPTAPENGQDEPRERDAGEDAQEALRRRLETKAKAGRATTEELRTLLNLCAQAHDAACLAQVKAQAAAKEAP